MKLSDLTENEKALWSFARANKVYYNLDRRFMADAWFLDGIEREKESVAGAGALVLARILDEADQLQKRIFLYPLNPRLRQYYKQFGFVDCEPPKDWMDRGAMVRFPATN